MELGLLERGLRIPETCEWPSQGIQMDGSERTTQRQCDVGWRQLNMDPVEHLGVHQEIKETKSVHWGAQGREEASVTAGELQSREGG